MSTATQGRAREHKVSKEMQAAGWVQVSRSAGSKGAADLIMVHPLQGVALIQVGTENKTLGPADRARLLDLAELCAALPILAACAPRQPIRYWYVTRDTGSTWDQWAP
jgi:hypothetical protein